MSASFTDRRAYFMACVESGAHIKTSHGLMLLISAVLCPKDGQPFNAEVSIARAQELVSAGRHMLLECSKHRDELH